MVDIINEIINEQMAYTEKSLAEIITKYDFIVGSIECKHRLMEVLPDGANIVCSQYITDPTMIYAIKKFDNYSHINNMDDCVECVKYADTIIKADRGE